jgi:pyruvate dehydrogenase (quinone)/pyruvate oxidase
MCTVDVITESLLDSEIEVIFGLPGDGINGFIEVFQRRQCRKVRARAP